MKALRIPLLLFALPAILLALAPACQGLFLLDRAGVARSEWWRLWTGHWVHFSGPHLAWNLAVLVAAGAWLERVHPGRLLRHTLLGAPLISLGLLAGEPALRTYGGLSGLATGVVVLLALTQLDHSRSDRMFWLGLLVLAAGKTAYDATHGTALFSRFDPATVRPSALAHLFGALVAGAYFAACLILAGCDYETPPVFPRKNPQRD